MNFKLEEDANRRQMTTLSVNISAGSNKFSFQALEGLKKVDKDLKLKAFELQKQIDDIRFQMAQNETELLLVFREIIKCDLFAPENYFDGDRLTKQGKYKSLSGETDDYLVPLHTFWLPIENHERILDPNSKEGREKYVHKHQEAGDQMRGKFLANCIKEIIPKHHDSEK